MAQIEIETFRLRDHVLGQAFRAADRRVQTEFAYQRPGFVRRTTAQSEAGEWAVVTWWADAAAADAASAAAAHDHAVVAWSALIDPASHLIERYEDLAG